MLHRNIPVRQRVDPATGQIPVIIAGTVRSDASGRWPADLLDGGALVTSHEWGYNSGPIAGREPIAFQRARVIGGWPPAFQDLHFPAGISRDLR